MKNLLTKGCYSRGGFTLIELLVSIAVLGILVLVAGQVYNDSTKFRVRSEGMIRSNAVANEVALYMQEDIGQTGAKSAKDADGKYSVIDSVYMDPTALTKDSSSFRISKPCNTCNTDTLTVRRVRYDGDGNFQAVEEVQWFTDDNVLYRKCRTIGNTSSIPSGDCPILDEGTYALKLKVAENIDTFKVIPAKPRIVSTDEKSSEALSYLLPSTDASVKEFRLVARDDEDDLEALNNIDPKEGGTSVTLSGFANNYDEVNNEEITTGKKANQVYVAPSDGTTGNWTQCKKVTLEPNAEYEISFKVLYAENESRMFCPGRDYAAVGFRNTEGAKIAGLEDFNFFFPASETESSERKFRFSVKSQAKDVCMAFTFAIYSPIATKGSVTFREVALKKVQTSGFDFEDENYMPREIDKKNVKGLLLKVVVNNLGEGTSIRQIIPIPSNGPRD